MFRRATLPTLGLLASILFALFVLEDVEIPVADELLAVTVLTVTFSILAHGVSAAPAARWYGAMTAPMGECEEMKPVSEMPTRTGTVTPPEPA